MKFVDSTYGADQPSAKQDDMGSSHGGESLGCKQKPLMMNDLIG